MKIQETKRQTSIREWVAMKLVRLAQWIYPKSEAVKAFYMQLIHDEIIYGQSIVCINPNKLIVSKDNGMYKQNRRKKNENNIT